MADHGILFDAMVYLGAAVVCVPVASRLRLGSVLGYLVAGCAIGPFGLGLVRDATATLHFAEFGVVLIERGQEVGRQGVYPSGAVGHGA